MEFRDVQRVGDRDYAMEWRMKPVDKADHETVLVYRELKFDTKIPSRVFTQQNLKRRI